nr:alpha/beta fold hydrolase [Paenibacillus zanthoxyli]
MVLCYNDLQKEKVININAWLSKGVDRYVLYSLHKERSWEDQYYPFRDELSDRSTFYPEPHETDIDINILKDDLSCSFGVFSYPSQIKTGDTFNDQSVGEFCLNKDNPTAPHIILVHGWRMKNLDRMKRVFLKSLTDQGWNVYFPSLPYHYGRKPESSLYSGEFMVSANIPRTLESVRQAVTDLRVLIRWIKNKHNQAPVFLVGVSIGGYITNLTATVEPEINKLVSIFYANRLPHSIWNTIPGKYIKADLEHHGVSYEELSKYWTSIDPSQTTPLISKEKILLLSAKYDQYIDIRDADRLWEAWGRPLRYVYECGHAGIELYKKRIAKDTISFLNSQI